MARHGENIRKRKDGRWEGRYLVYSKEEGRKLYRSVYGRSYGEAKEKLIVKKYHLINEDEAENTYTKTKTDNREKGRRRRKGSGNGNGMKDDTDKTHIEGKASEEIFNGEKVGGEVYDGTNGSGKIFNEANISKEISGETNVGEGIWGEVKVGGEISDDADISREVSNEATVGRIIFDGGNASTGNSNREGITEKSDGYEVKEGKASKILEFSIIASEWLTTIKAFRKPSTYVKYQIIYQNYLKNHFENTELSAITSPFVQEKVSAALSESIGKSIYCVLNQILKYAAEKYAVFIPALKRPAAHMPKKLINVFSRKEQSRLLAALYHKTDRFKAAVLLCLHTGLRLGELCALKWTDIDMKNQFVLIARSVQRLYVDGHQTKTILLEAPPKSVHSRREIPLPPGMFKLFSEYSKEKEYVFGGDRPVDPRTMQNQFKKILEEAAIENKNFHALRHTFSTNCIEGGADAKSLSELLGHSDVQITLNRYVHPSMDTKLKHLEGLSVFYARISGQIHGQDCD